MFVLFMAAEGKTKCAEEKKNLLIYPSSSGSFLSSCILVAELCEQRGGEGSGAEHAAPLCSRDANPALAHPLSEELPQCQS